MAVPRVRCLHRCLQRKFAAFWHGRWREPAPIPVLRPLRRPGDPRGCPREPGPRLPWGKERGMALGVTVPRAADSGGLRWGRDPAVIAAPPPLSGLGRGSRTAPLGTTLGQGRASACARRERDGGRRAGQGSARRRR